MGVQIIFKSALKRSVAGAALALAIAGGAGAQDVEALEARIAALEAMIGELRDEVVAARTQTETMQDRVIRIERATPAATTAAAAPEAGQDGFMAGNTHITYGGFIDVDAHVTEFSDGDVAPTSIARDFYIPGAIPVGGSGDGEADADFTAQGTRFFFATETPTETGMGSLKSRLEFDFLGSPGGNERVSNSYNPRLRVAWAQLGAWRVGQDWSTFQNTAAIPESASFLVASDGMVFVRQAQVRYTDGPFQIALENPDTTVTPFGGGARIDAGDGALPDLVARYNWTGDFGNISVSGLARRLSAQTGAIDGDAFGWGVSVQGRAMLGEGSDLRFSFTGGEGLGRYIGLNAVNGAVADASGDLEPIASYGGLIALRQSLGQGRRINVGYSFLEADNDLALNGGSATKSVWSGFGNYMISLAPGVTLGAELLFGERELENGQTGSITRATLSTKYSF
ncbi:MAG: DcaP family trimeric outer membrane transporter [Pseudomonadota bacterium]